MVAVAKENGFHDFFSVVDDPRLERRKAHALLDILFLCVAGTVAGCEGPSGIAEFAREKLAWFRRFVPLRNGVPSHDTIGRVMGLLKPEQFQRAFLDCERRGELAIVGTSAGRPVSGTAGCERRISSVIHQR
jgi:hypothetical protein